MAQSKITIRKCAIEFQFQCPRDWNQLRQTADSSIRYCAACEQNVYHCETDDETIRHARAGHCVARAEPAERGERDHVMGILGMVEPRSSEDRGALEWSMRERGIQAAISEQLTGEERSCVKCHYPVPDWRKTCFVCGYLVGYRIQSDDSA